MKKTKAELIMKCRSWVHKIHLTGDLKIKVCPFCEMYIHKIEGISDDDLRSEIKQIGVDYE